MFFGGLLYDFGVRVFQCSFSVVCVVNKFYVVNDFDDVGFFGIEVD